MRRPPRICTSVPALVVIAALAVQAADADTARAQAQPPTTPAYCDPGATAFDPADVPRGGSKPIRKRGVRYKRIKVGGVRTPVLESGPRGKREAVVFLHGVLGSSQDWVDLAQRVGRSGRRAIAFDLPGFGRASPAWAYQPTFANYARFFREALRKLGVKRAHLVLHDIAGPIALEWALKYPRRTGRIALIDGGLLLGYVPHPIHIAWALPGGEAVQRALTRTTFEAGTREGQTKRPLPRSFLKRSYDDQDRETRCAVLRFFRGAASAGVDPSAAIKQAAALRRTFGSRRPVLVIWGENDPYLRVGMAVRQREAFPSARKPRSGRKGLTSANAWSQDGIEPTGTKVEEAKVSGKMIMNPIACADSPEEAVRAISAKIHEKA